eukprot:TRINITY_DN5489_c0_g2_i2.p1 TRINITY_DN5489_c0_g2~~TRINITY_DN5489_c0_g2_i2.p1  ORF type:complete len:397 (+),score=46.63 TRINITY_DN5489_c0_g2_i2:132-1322(+)
MTPVTERYAPGRARTPTGPHQSVFQEVSSRPRLAEERELARTPHCYGRSEWTVDSPLMQHRDEWRGAMTAHGPKAGYSFQSPCSESGTGPSFSDEYEPSVTPPAVTVVMGPSSCARMLDEELAFAAAVTADRRQTSYQHDAIFHPAAVDKSTVMPARPPTPRRKRRVAKREAVPEAGPGDDGPETTDELKRRIAELESELRRREKGWQPAPLDGPSHTAAAGPAHGGWQAAPIGGPPPPPLPAGGCDDSMQLHDCWSRVPPQPAPCDVSAAMIPPQVPLVEPPPPPPPTHGYPFSWTASAQSPIAPGAYPGQVHPDMPSLPTVRVGGQLMRPLLPPDWLQAFAQAQQVQSASGKRRRRRHRGRRGRKGGGDKEQEQEDDEDCDEVSSDEQGETVRV